ncbi:outer membrane beta-barrel protein [Neorhizobium alkalisoli]|uniref:Beta-barrel porin 2 n=1 Tax=Neorhizobium alkalisoli TaxID=528178 RepID=A0A561QNK8_9HYPH|nr:outer membrane beta-barrel protein [Neorhizobium alkalisoli]TWF51906.1 hypothetical protein FHW37_1052 [Neorhizobium alkalisoli]
MTTSKNTGTLRHRRRQAFGLLLACSALVGPAAVRAQSLFPSNDSPLPSLSGQQIGTAGTTTITRNAQPATAGQSGSTYGTDTLAGDGTASPNLTTLPATERTLQQDEDELNQPYEQPLDNGAEAIDQQEQPRTPVDPTGIRLGTFMLRPSVNQSVNTEITRESGRKETRDFLATGIRGTLTSDWSRHALTVTGEGTFEHDFAGNRQRKNDPEGRLDADLRLDLSDDTVAHIKGGYGFTREDNDDPNAIGGAAVQSGVNEFDGGLSLQRDLGRIRALAAVDGRRYVYTDAKLSDGTVLNMKDRNRSSIDGRLRLGYELSAALIPFAEIATGHTFYDRKRDASGYERSSRSYALRTGIEFDLGEKLRGEVGTGYQMVRYDDERLDNVGAITFDGNAIWSPQRGTDVNFGLRSTVQDSTTAGQSGWVQYDLTAALAHEMRDNLVARLSGSATFRNFRGGSDGSNITWVIGPGLTWNINRYLDLTGDIEYERTTGDNSSNQNIVRAGVGLTLKR